MWRVNLRDPEFLSQIGLTLYERKSLMALMVLGVADAAALCREGNVPTSKIYRAMEKLAQLGLVETQPTRPKMYAALAPVAVAERAVDLSRERAERFAAGAEDLGRLLASLPGRVEANSRSSIWPWGRRATSSGTSSTWRQRATKSVPTWSAP